MEPLNSWWRDLTGSRVTPSMYLDSFGAVSYTHLTLPTTPYV